MHFGAREHVRAARPAIRAARACAQRPRPAAGESARRRAGRDDGRHALLGEGVEQGIGLPVVDRAVVDAGEHVRVHVHERPVVHSLVHGSPIDAEGGGLEDGIAQNLASFRTSRRRGCRGYPAAMRIRAMLTIAGVLAVPATAQAADLYVDPTQAGCSDTVGADVATQPGDALVLADAGPGARAPGRHGASRERDVSLAAAPAELGHRGAADRLPGRRPGHDRRPCGYHQRDADRRPRRGAARLHRARRGAAGDLDRRREPDPDRPHDGRERSRRGRADQGRHRESR